MWNILTKVLKAVTIIIPVIKGIQQIFTEEKKSKK